MSLMSYGQGVGLDFQVRIRKGHNFARIAHRNATEASGVTVQAARGQFSLTTLLLKTSNQ